MKNYLPNLIFIILLLVTAIIYDYHQIAFKRPQSTHAWRQADGASMALNYSREGMQFFQPRVHNLTSDHGTSGRSASSEMPLLYFTVAFLYRIFGYHEFIYRILNTLIFLTGIYYLFKTLKFEFKDLFWATTIPLFIFSSPVLVYYGNNFLTNTSAFSMVLISWYHVFRYFRSHKKRDLQKVFLFFLLAGALKVTALLSFFALAGIFLLEWTGWIRLKNRNKKYFPNPGLTIAAGIILLIPIISWIIYAKHYNETHSSTYFSTTFFPLWSLKPESIKNIISTIREIWLKEYYHPASLIFLAGLTIINFMFLQKDKKIYGFILLFLFIEALFYIVLQFWTFRDHDYYIINLYILPVMILLSSVSMITKASMPRILSYVLKTTFAAFVIFNIFYSAERIRVRYNGYMNNNYREKIDFYTLGSHFRDLGIQPEDKVISFSDFGHVSLYLMDQKGWTRYTDMLYNRGKPIRYNQDSTGIQQSINRGAKYIIINGFDDLYNNKYLHSFTNHLVSAYRNLLIFKTGSQENNFKLKERKTLYTLSCSAEKTDEEEKHFTDGSGKFLFGNLNTRSAETSLTGEYSVRLNKENPYGMTCMIQNLKHGESLKACVWKKGSENPGVIIFQAEDYNFFHKAGAELTGNTKGEWVEIMLEIFIPYEMSGKNIKMYLYHNKETAAFFDDLTIFRYQSLIN